MQQGSSQTSKQKKMARSWPRFYRLPLTLVASLVLSISALPSYPAQVSLTWDPPAATDTPPTSQIAGYYVYVGNTSGQYIQRIDAGPASSYLASNLADGTTYYFSVTAYDQYGNESGFSNETSKAFPASNPAANPAPVPTTVPTQSAPASGKGDVDGDGNITIADALLVLNAAIHKTSLPAGAMSRGDVWPPSADGQPGDDGQITINDALMILQRAIALTNW